MLKYLGWNYEVDEKHEVKPKAKSYGANFAWRKKKEDKTKKNFLEKKKKFVKKKKKKKIKFFLPFTSSEQFGKSNVYISHVKNGGVTCK